MLNSRKLTDSQIHELAADLLGSSQDIGDALEQFNVEFDDLTTDDCAELDSHVMLCERCGWWAESCEVDEDGVCDDCRVEE